ncbi:MAG: hypothetical protein U1A27_04215 [Phycisphaerae bacterium]
MTRFDWLADILRQWMQIIDFFRQIPIPFPKPWPDPGCLSCPFTDLLGGIGQVIGQAIGGLGGMAG